MRQFMTEMQRILDVSPNPDCPACDAKDAIARTFIDHTHIARVGLMWDEALIEDFLNRFKSKGVEAIPRPQREKLRTLFIQHGAISSYSSPTHEHLSPREKAYIAMEIMSIISRHYEIIIDSLVQRVVSMSGNSDLILGELMTIRSLLVDTQLQFKPQVHCVMDHLKKGE